MNRDEFLKTQWKAYPILPLNREGLLYGRIQNIEKEHIEFLFQKNSMALLKKEISIQIDGDLGASIPPDFLWPGDVVAYSNQEKCFFLLAPNLTERNITVDPSLQDWNDFLHQIEGYFLKEEFLQARTPFLVACPGVDHHIDYLEVRGSRSGKTWYLPTSPEIHLKKLLCQGVDRVFEIKNCFRDDLEGEHHRVEFTMLEWYRCFEPLESLVVDLEKLLSLVMKKKVPVKRVSLSDRFKETTGYSLTPQTTKEELLKILKSLSLDSHSSDDWNDLFFRIYMEKVEPTLGQEEPEVIFGFPAQQASLAQINQNGWAERFELYYKGVELANAYLEVNDPEENKKRFLKEKALREASEKEVARLDNEFFEKLRQGMPPSCGIALGLNRLYMLSRGLTHI